MIIKPVSIRRFACCATLVAITILPFSAKAAELNSSYPYTSTGTAPPAQHHDLIQGSHVEGHIAFLRAELDITPAQEQLWAPVVDAMREDVKNLEEADERVSKHMHGPENAIQYLQNRALFEHLRADGETRFLTAFKSLYGSFSSEQKQVADQLFIPDDNN